MIDHVSVGARDLAKAAAFLFARERHKSSRCFPCRALQAGVISGGAPGLRPHFGEGYYAAFVAGPDGNRIEAVTFVK